MNQEYDTLGPEDRLQENDQWTGNEANEWSDIPPFKVGIKVCLFVKGYQFRRPRKASGQEKDVGDDLKLSGKVYDNVDSLVEETSPEVQASYYKLQVADLEAQVSTLQTKLDAAEAALRTAREAAFEISNEIIAYQGEDEHVEDSPVKQILDLLNRISGKDTKIQTHFEELRNERDALRQRAEDAEKKLERMHCDALGYLAKYTYTPEEGYIKAPHCLSHDIDRVGRERDTLKERVKTAVDAIELILPLAKGYAHANQVGSNLRYIEVAVAWLHESKSEGGKDLPALGNHIHSPIENDYTGDGGKGGWA